jgi:NAD+ synthase (glutamine-hydrolysing)
MPPPGRPPSPLEEYFDDLLEAMIAGLDYFVKTRAFKKLGIALSGGKDSVLTLIVAWLFAQRRFASLAPEARKAAVADFIQCFSMPSRYNSATTQNISRTLCAELGATLTEVSIEDAFAREVAAAEAMLGPGEKLTDLTRQNIQARIRGQRMWNWANNTGGMWLQTSNMSEKAVGYTTIGGDMMGAYSLIANLPKTVIIELLRHIAEKHGWKGVRDVLATRASAELADNQEDEKDLMPFPVLDACFALFAGEKMTPQEVYRVIRGMWTDEELKALAPQYQTGMLKTWVRRFTNLFVGSIFNWVQTPQAVHLGTLDLDRERALQLPVVQSREWLDLQKLEEE